MKLLLVEDDSVLSEAVADALSSYGYIVDVADNGEDGWEHARQSDYGVILLDYNLPGLDGMSLCRRIRAKGDTTPILMMTARHASSDKVAGLDAGADDYIVKPVDLPELMARLRALLRRDRVNSTAQWQAGELHLDSSKHMVTFKGTVINLTPKEFSLLELFVHNEERVLSRKVIISHLWDLEDAPTEESVKAHVKSLRSKLIKAGAAQDLIETVWGVGYRFQSY